MQKYNFDNNQITLIFQIKKMNDLREINQQKINK